MKLPGFDKTMRFRIFLVLAITVVAAAKFHERRDDLIVLYRQRFTDPKTIREYFETHSIRKLQLGFGSISVLSQPSTRFLKEWNPGFARSARTFG